MTRRWDRLGCFVMCVAIVAIAAGCDEDTTDDETDMSVDGTTDGTPTDTGSDMTTSGNFLEESTLASDEFPDCITDCGHETPVARVDLRTFELDGVRGRIDSECHEYFGPDTMGPDRDVIQILADTRTMVDITVEPDGNAAFKAVLITVDGARIMNFAVEESEGSNVSHVRYAHPQVGSMAPMYLVIDHFDNYSAYSPPHTDCSAFTGDLGYVVRFNAVPFEATALGTLEPGNTLSASGELARGGDAQYYTFMADGDADFTVTATNTGSSEFEITLVGLNTIEGQAVWDTVAHDNGASSQNIDQTEMRACFGDACGGTLYEYGFAIIDWNGAAFPGEFTYDVTVTSP